MEQLLERDAGVLRGAMVAEGIPSPFSCASEAVLGPLRARGRIELLALHVELVRLRDVVRLSEAVGAARQVQEGLRQAQESSWPTASPPSVPVPVPGAGVSAAAGAGMSAAAGVAAEGAKNGQRTGRGQTAGSETGGGIVLKKRPHLPKASSLSAAAPEVVPKEFQPLKQKALGEESQQKALREESQPHENPPINTAASQDGRTWVDLQKKRLRDLDLAVGSQQGI